MRLAPRQKKLLLMAVGMAVTLGCLWYVARQVDFSGVGRALAHMNPWWLGPVALTSLGSFFFRVLRWRRLLASTRRVPLGAAFQAYVLGNFANVVFPLRAGEITRVLVIGHSQELSRSSALASLVVERVLDLATLLALLALTLALFPLPAWATSSAWVLLGLVAAGVALLAVIRFSDLCSRWLLALLERLLPAKWAEPASRMLISFRSGLAGPAGAQSYLALLAETLGTWGCFGLSIYLMLWGLDLVRPYDLGLLAVLVVVVLLTMGVAVPSGPAQVGPFHLSAMVALNLFGVPMEQGLGWALIYHFLNLLIIVVLGLWMLKGLGRGLAWLGSQTQESPPAEEQGS